MEREHIIIVALLLLVLYNLMKHSSDCNCAQCNTNGRTLNATGSMPGHIRMRQEDPLEGTNATGSQPGHIRMNYSDKYIGASQYIGHHLRRDSRAGMFNGLFSGTPNHIRYGNCPDGTTSDFC